MIDPLIRWSLHNRMAIIAGALLLTCAGFYSMRRMPVDVFPDLTAPTVTVITEAHGMAPTEVESQVTFPIEAALNGASGVRRVRSSTAVGISVVWVEFAWGVEIYTARQIVSEKVALIAGDLPPEVKRPILAPISSIMGEILFLALTSPQHSLIEIRTVADTVLRRRLLSVPGVSQVTPIGGGGKQYQVLLAPAQLRTYGITLQQVTQALTASNENVSAGFMVVHGSEYLVTGRGRLRTPADVSATVISAENGVPLRVADLGSVRIDAAPQRGEGSLQAEPAVILSIQKQPGANTLTLTQALEAVLTELQAQLPAGMQLTRVLRQADFIEVAVQNVVHALRDGGLLVVVIVLLFLANLRAACITLTAIPLSLLAAVLVLKAFDATINTMTLGGMAIAIGALVDDAVIDVENVFRRLRENAALPAAGQRSALQVVYQASVEIRASIVFATLIILLVFLPLFFLAGVEGRLLQPLGVAYVVSLLASLAVAVTVTPVLCLLLLPSSRAVQRGDEALFVRLLKTGYAPLLAFALRFPWIVTAPALLLLGGAMVVSGSLGRAFLPDFNEGALTISAVTLPGTSLAESANLGRVVERTLMAHPEVVSVARRTGRAELDEHAQGVEAAELDVALKLRERGKAAFLQALRRDLSLIPGMNITIGQPISHRIDHMLSGTRANIAVKIFGEDLYTLRMLGEKARQAMATVPGVVDLSVEPQLDIPTLSVRFDRQAMARYGVMVETAAHTLEAALQGVTVSRVLEGRYAFDLVVRLQEPQQVWTPDTIQDLLVDTPGGAKIPLRLLAHIAKTSGPNTISREQVERKIVVMCNVAGRDVASVVRDIAQGVQPILAAHPGYSVAYGGQFESAEEAGRLLSVLSLAVLLGIGFLLYLAFGSSRDAVLIMVNLPLALIGGIAGVVVSGGVLSVASLIGFITVFGIATRNGIMLVSHIRHVQEHEGVTDFRSAVFQGAMERLSPILMTALASALALIPLALSGDKPGNEIQTPMAIVILGGLLTSMILNMVIVPALYLRFARPVLLTVQGGTE